MTKKVLDNVGLTYFWGKIKSAFASKVPSATDGNLAGLDSSGNLTDSGKKASDFATASDVSAKYTKPSTGIPKTDLASAVQTSLGKADTALQSYTETDPTVPSWAKQSTKPSYDYSEIGNTPTIPTVPTNVSAFTNDAGYITSSGVVTIYSGNTTPSSSLGSNGDIYIKTT